MNLHHIKRSDSCLNCGTRLDPETDHYCPYCGQLNNTQKETVGHLLRDLVEEFLHLDSKVMRSLVPLITKPGKIAKEYIAGQRVRYFHPVRMFLTLTVILFIVMGSDKSHKNEPAANDAITLYGGSSSGGNQDSADIDTISGVSFSRSALRRYMTKDGITDPSALMDSIRLERSVVNRLVFGLYLKSLDRSRMSFDDFLMTKAHWILFTMMPVFAIALFMFYGRRHFTVVDHLVHAFYMHSGVFLILIVSGLISMLLYEHFDVILVLLLPAYYLVSLRTVYEQSWLMTILMGLGVGFAYMTMAGFVFGLISVILVFVW